MSDLDSPQLSPTVPIQDLLTKASRAGSDSAPPGVNNTGGWGMCVTPSTTAGNPTGKPLWPSRDKKGAGAGEEGREGSKLYRGSWASGAGLARKGPVWG